MLFIDTLLFVLALNVIGFLVAFRLKSDKLTDFSYGLSFLLTGVYAFSKNSNNLTSKVFLALVLLWSVRIAGFLLIRIIKIKRDKRFDGVRENFFKFGQFWIMQAITAWIIMIPALFIFEKNPATFSHISLIGIAAWLVGFLFETISDFQKLNFTQNPKNKDKWIEEGLWSVSRHPNYFGEILMWLGIYIAALPYLTNGQVFIGIISPLWISFLLIFVTGIPKLEQYADDKWGSQTAYKQYKKRVSVLVPWL